MNKPIQTPMVPTSLTPDGYVRARRALMKRDPVLAAAIKEIGACGMKFRELKLRKDPDCPVCGTHPTVKQLIDYEQFCGIVPAKPEPVAVNHATEITALELKQRLDRGDALTIVDVREPNEYQINRIPGSVLIPLGDIPKRYNELDPSAELIMQCKSGARSGRAADFLRSVGFKRVLNLKGGILDWIDKVDPSQPKY